MECKLEFLYYTILDHTFYVNFHRHECFELVYYINGSGSTTIDGHTYRYSPNTFSIMIPGAYHDQKHDKKTEVIYIGFTYSQQPFEIHNSLYCDLPTESILNAMKFMKTEFVGRCKYSDIKLDSLLKSLLVDVGRTMDETVNREHVFAYIEMFIQENCGQKIDMRNLAQLSGYSYNRFRYLFKESTGQSPIEYILIQRINKAKRLLMQTQMGISDIAQECGFYDHSQFSHIFKRIEGITPYKYKTR
jgi:AraC-like DNA-binding protein